MENEESIEKAYKAWQQAEIVFNNAVTKEDIDYAVYNLEAKKRHYMRLLRRQRESTATDFE